MNHPLQTRSRRRSGRTRLRAIATLLLLAGIAGCGRDDAKVVSEVNSWVFESNLSQVEDTIGRAEVFLGRVAKHLANRDVDGLDEAFASDYRGVAFTDVKWNANPLILQNATIHTADGSNLPSIDRHAQLADLKSLLERYSQIEKVGFKVVDVLSGPKPIVLDIRLNVTGTLDTKRTLTEMEGRLGLVEAADGFSLASLTVGKLRRQAVDRTFFTEVTRLAGIRSKIADANNKSPAAFEVVSRGNVSVGDWDNDGLDDFVIAAALLPILYRNQRDGSFVQVPVQGFTRTGNWTGALWIDYDGDDDLDLMLTQRLHSVFVPSGGGPARRNNSVALYRNDRNGVFSDVTDAAGLGSLHGFYLSLAAADVDGNGTLDVYLCNYNGSDAQGKARNLNDIFYVGDRKGGKNTLLRNNGNGTFTDVTDESGTGDTGWTYMAGFFDMDNDGDEDLYVVNDYGANTLFRNLGNGKFEDITTASGTTDIGNGMGLAVADVNHDGLLDFHVANMFSKAGRRILKRAIQDAPKQAKDATLNSLLKESEGNTLFVNNGDGTFRDVSRDAGIVNAQWSWGGSFIDYDLDGEEDLFVPNGMISGPNTKDT